MDPHTTAAKRNTSHGNKVLPQDTTHVIQRPCYQQGSPCQDPVGPHGDLLATLKRLKLEWYGHVSRSLGLAKTILQGTSERGKKTRQTHVEVGRQHKAMDNFSGPVRTADLLLLLLLLLFFIAVLLEIKSNQKAIDDFAKSPNWCQLG